MHLSVRDLGDLLWRRDAEGGLDAPQLVDGALALEEAAARHHLREDAPRGPDVHLASARYPAQVIASLRTIYSKWNCI